MTHHRPSRTALTVFALAIVAPGTLAARPPAHRPHAMLAGKIAATVTAPLDINTAGKPQLSPLPVLSSEAKAAILNFRTGTPYASGDDLATRVCSRVAVDFGPTDILIGSTVYQGFKCAAPASGSYFANGGMHAYALAVEVTGSATIPAAPPSQ